MKRINIISFLVIFLLILTCVGSLVGCKEKEETSEALFITSGELFSDEKSEGLILDGMVYFASLGIDRNRITEYGYIYSFDCPENMQIDDDVVRIKGDITNQNHLTIKISVDEACYNKDLSFRMYIKYHEINSDEEKILYSFSYGACNLYELAKNDPSDFAKRVVKAVENK